MAQQQQNFDAVEIQALKVRDNIYMLVGDGGNITMQVGDDGILIVDTQFAPLSDKIVAAIRKISPKPIHYIVNTHHHGDHTGGNANLRAAGTTVSGGNMAGAIRDSGVGAAIVAHENVLLRLSSETGPQATPSGGWPTSTFFGAKKELYYNGEGIESHPRAGCAHRRRQHRVLPPLGRDLGGRRVRHDELSVHRHGERRQLSGFRGARSRSSSTSSSRSTAKTAVRS